MWLKKVLNPVLTVLKIVFVVVLLAAGARFYFGAQQDLEDVTIAEFVNCLNESGVIMYGSGACEYCSMQKQMFGKEFKRLNYVDCSIKTDLCKQNQIIHYPHWQFKEDSLLGLQSFSNLAQMSYCEEPTII